MKRCLVVMLALLISIACVACPSSTSQQTKYEITYIAGEGGHIQGESFQTIEKGGEGQEVIATADEGYVFSHWSDGETTPNRTEKDVQENISLTAAFTKIEGSVKLNITYKAGEGGTLSASGQEDLEFITQEVTYGGNSHQIEAVPNAGYRFSRWSDDNPSRVRMDMKIKVGFSMTAIFQKIDDAIFLNAMYKAGEGGLIEGENGEQRTYFIQSILMGYSSVPVKAVPQSGFEFVRWSDGSTANPRTDSNVKYSFTVTAIFAKIEEPASIQVIYKAGNGGLVNNQSQFTQNVVYGEDAQTVTVAAQQNYEFVAWSDGLTTPTRTDTNITYGFTVTATFKKVFAEGDGTLSNPYLIDSIEQFNKIALFPSANYKLINDLDFSGIDHAPLFDNSQIIIYGRPAYNRFNGTFDGDNHIISNVTIDEYHQFPSLFGFVGSFGTIKNLIMSDVTIKVPNFIVNGSPLCVGAVAGVSLGLIQNITVSGEITAEKLDYNGVAIGGVVGETGSQPIENCVSDIMITLNQVASGSFYVGGLAGMVSLDVISCSSKSQIEVDFTDNKNYRGIGGLIGQFLDMNYTDDFTVDDCHAETTIKTDGKAECGGLIAYIDSIHNVTITDSSANADINSDGSSGGLVSVLYANNLLIDNSFAQIEIAVQRSWVGGFAYNINAVGGTISNCYVSGSIEGGNIAGFAANIRSDIETSLNVNSCYSDVYAKALFDAAGFAMYALDINFFRCYSIGKTEAENYATGFVYDLSMGQKTTFRGYVKECFSTGDVISTSYAYGFMSMADDHDVINCYSTSDVYIIAATKKSNISAIGFMEYLYDCSLFNCYYSGKIIVDGTASYTDIAVFGISVRDTSIISNCHWVKYSDGDASEAVLENLTQTPLDITEYSSESELYLLADALNGEQDDTAWVNLPNRTPELAYMTT
jgi:hypothetical protein